MFPRNSRRLLKFCVGASGALGVGLCFVALGSFAHPALAADFHFVSPQLNVPIPGLDYSQYPIVLSVNKASIPYLSAYISVIYRYIVGISVIAAAVMIVYGGFKYILSSTAGSVNGAKETIIDAIVGLILVFGTYAIITLINSNLASSLPPLQVDVIARDEYQSHVNDLDGVPLDQMEPWDRPTSSTAPTK